MTRFNTISLKSRGILMKVSCHKPGNTKTDQDVTEEVAESHHCSGSPTRVGRYIKNLFDPNSMKAINSAVAEIKRYMSSKTLPWGTGGWFFVEKSMFEEKRKGLGARKQRFDKAAKDWLEKYENAVEDAKLRLGPDLFNENDYPPKEVMEKKFGVSVKFRPVPNSEDVIIDISEKELQEIKNQLRKEELEKLNDWTNLLWNRLYKYIKKIHDKMKEGDSVNTKGETKPPRFRKEMLEHLQSLVPLLSKLNVMDDKNLEEMRRNLERSLVGTISAEELRNNANARVQVKDETKKFLDVIPDNVKEK
ncbi:MAG: hypothetical protein ACTSU7_02880 [Candidatus Heimdallarchaeaceae archaeon]